MTGAIESRAEAAKLARLLRLDGPEALAFVYGVPAEELRRYREELTDLLFDGDRLTFQRLANAARLLPARTAARVAQRALGPLICARVTGLVEPSRAADIARSFSVEFLAQLAAELDPRRAIDVITAMPHDAVCDVAVAMAADGEHVAMGRFVAHLDRAALLDCIARLGDEDLLRVAFVLEDEDRLGALLELVGSERAAALFAHAAAFGPPGQAEDLLAHLAAGGPRADPARGGSRVAGRGRSAGGRVGRPRAQARAATASVTPQRPRAACARAQAMMFALPLIVEPSGRRSTGSFSWPLSSFSRGRRPVVNSANGIPRPAITLSKSWPAARSARCARLHACGGGPPSSM